MQITINKTITVLEIITQNDKYDNDIPKTKLLFEETNIHEITKTKEVWVETLKVDTECLFKFEKGKKYLVDLSQVLYEKQHYYKIVKAVELK